MGVLFSIFSGNPRERAEPCGRLINLASYNNRGLLGGLAVIISFGVYFTTTPKSTSVVFLTWAAMFWLMLFETMEAAACALVPIFCLPFFGIVDSKGVCQAMVNEFILFYFLHGWLLLLLCSCDLHKRLACYILARGGSDTFTPKQLLWKVSLASYLVSGFADRELTTQIMLDYVTSAVGPMGKIAAVDFEELNVIMCMAVAISSILGSLILMHGPHTMTLAKSISLPDDSLNFLGYNLFAIPTTFIMLGLNFFYMTQLINRYAQKIPLPNYSRVALQQKFVKNKNDLGPMTGHQKVSLFFYSVLFILYLTRHSTWFGWSAGGVRDVTVAALFVVGLHALPSSTHFMKIWTAKKRGDLPEMKQASAILHWKYIDKHMDYSRFLILGGGMLMLSGGTSGAIMTDLGPHLAHVTSHSWEVQTLVLVLAATALGILMPSLCAQACMMPAVVLVGSTTPNWLTWRHVLTMGVAWGSSFSFCARYTLSPLGYLPSIVPQKKQIRYAILSMVICELVLWVSLTYYATHVLAAPVASP